ncbi:pyridoxamine 5'-phosphate oxidase family protein [Pseudomonas sp. S75]|uniref:pyridoxamine 5'-phosphate oxidase family protein n=1 Tax=unclassified Pseudomonas TaxID=196821 RepID=UPI00190451B0|nr:MULTISPECIES: pyridoxamine 5'-phosphate oxidase family protein [unclassified Pseudomonas]MBJ9975876.1 pyridoxamine 5'-phosphate oxidase family protein [Pseudomonas sp. S30]MBK0154616.1 pyridoxamine 5'-phosphate oxidase family protein [Pseudomonas sp. S75]
MTTISEPSLLCPWHAGERALQRSVGALERMVSIGRTQLSRNAMPDQHRRFYAQLPFVVLGSVDRSGDPWATLRVGEPGFMQAPEPRRLVLRLPCEPADPAQEGLQEGEGIGLLGIELHTRRRNRLNGTIRDMSATGFAIEPNQCYGNCPRYIHRRTCEPWPRSPGTPIHSTTLSPQDHSLIVDADTFYVASYVESEGTRQVDVSHRGGEPGFVQVDPCGRLTIPDFNGNAFFNTLGNLLINPRAGLLFVDRAQGDLLQMSGRTEVLLDDPQIAGFVGAERLWRFYPERLVRRPGALSLRWIDEADGLSPHVQRTANR